jgi:hypothetical protein
VRSTLYHLLRKKQNPIGDGNFSYSAVTFQVDVFGAQIVTSTGRFRTFNRGSADVEVQDNEPTAQWALSIEQMPQCGPLPAGPPGGARL